MIAVVILIVFVTVLSVYSAFGTYQNQQDIKALTDVTKGIVINAKHICQILEMLKEQEAKPTPTAGTNEIPLKWYGRR